MASDNFTDTNGTHLLDHTASMTWTNTTGTNPDDYTIQSNQVYGAAWKAAVSFASTSTVDSSQITWLGNQTYTHGSKPCVRMPSNNIGYAAHLSDSSGGNWTEVTITKNGSYFGTYSSLSYAQSDNHTIKITASGSSPVTLEVFVDGVSLGTKSDSSSPLASGYSGFSVATGSRAAGALMDDWTDGAAGGESVTLTMSSGVQSNVGGVPSLALQTNLVVANSTNQNVGNAIGSPPLKTSLSIANGVNANIGNAISDVPLQAIVSTADGIQQNVGDAIGLTSEFLLELFDGIQQNVCDVANITVEFVLLTADGVQQNVTGLITLVVESDTGTEYTLTIYDGAQVQVGEALELSLETPLPTADGVQQNIADAVELAAEYIMSVLGSYHVNAGDAIGDLPIQITVTASDGTQVNVADAFDVAGKITLALANGIQITTDDMSAITIEALLNTLDGIQKNVGGEILLSVSSAGDIIARILRVVSKTPNRQITSKTPVRTIASKTTTKTIHLIVD